MTEGGDQPAGAGGRSPGRWLAAGVAITGIVASLVTVAAFVLDVVPGSGESCPQIGASLERVRAQPNIALADFLAQANQPATGYDAAHLQARVNGIFADVVIDGYRGSHLTLRWSMFDARSGRLVRNSTLQNRPALDIEPSTCHTRLRSAVWTPVARPGARLVRLTIVDEDDHVLAESRTVRV